MRWNAKLVAGLMVLSISLLSITWFVHPRVRIGFIASEGVDNDTVRMIMDGFSIYDDYMSVEILPEEFNTSGIRAKEENYLVSDFYRMAEENDLRDTYDVDLLIMITDHRIQNWDEDGMPGIAYSSTPRCCAVITTSYWDMEETRNVTVSQHVALRHTFHLIGYPRNMWDEECIMDGDDESDVLSLSPYYRVQLPLRLYLFKGLTGGNRFVINNLSYGIFVAVISPFVLAAEFTITAVYRKIFGMRRNPFLFYMNLFLSLIVIFLTNGTFLVFAIPPMIMLFTHNGLMTASRLKKL